MCYGLITRSVMVTNSASPRRSVCAPGTQAFPSSRKPEGDGSMKTLPVRSARFVVALRRAAARFAHDGAPAPLELWLGVLMALVSLWGANVASAQTMEGLGFLPNSVNHFSMANAVSADGSTVVGVGVNGQGDEEAFLWTAHGGMKGLGTLPDSLGSVATGVSADGSTVVGYSSNVAGGAFIWTAATRMVGLGGIDSSATGVSA